MKVRIAAVQYHLRHVQDWAGFESQVDFVLDAAAEYRPQFVLLPEIFTTQLMSLLDVTDVRRAVRELSAFTPQLVDLMRRHAEARLRPRRGEPPHDARRAPVQHGLPLQPGRGVFEQDKLHRTRWEKDHWDTTPGESLSLFETAHGKIAILVCYDVEFPELARQVSEAGADILFVPSCTDDRQGFLRVRYCCHARAIENQVYVAMTSTVGNLRVSGLRMHYGQAAILAPSDFPSRATASPPRASPTPSRSWRPGKPDTCRCDLAFVARARLRGLRPGGPRYFFAPASFIDSSFARSSEPTAERSTSIGTPRPFALTTKRSATTTVNSASLSCFEYSSWTMRLPSLRVRSTRPPDSFSPWTFIQPASPMRPAAPPVSVTSSSISLPAPSP